MTMREIPRIVAIRKPMAIKKITANEFNNTFYAGINLIYTRTNSKGETVHTALAFTGEPYAPENLDQTSVFKAWRALFITYWETYAKIDEWAKDNAGIKTLLTGTAPSEIVVVDAKAERTKRFSIPGMIASLGMKPSATDIKRLKECKTNRDRNRLVNAAATAAFDALSFRINFEKYEVKKEEEAKKDEKAA